MLCPAGRLVARAAILQSVRLADRSRRLRRTCSWRTSSRV